MSIIAIKGIQLLLALAILVFIHELGHFLFARLFRIRVDKFYLFFDPWFSIFKYKPKGSHTEYGLGWLPLGGYCKIAGMVDESMDTAGLETEPKSWEFRAKPVWQRLLVMLGGILFNLILAIVIYTGIARVWGETKIPMANVGNNLEYTELGLRMGLQDGDRPYAIDGNEIEYFDENLLSKIAEGHLLTVWRDSKKVDIEVPGDLMRAIIASEEPLYVLNIPAQVGTVVAGSQGEKAGIISGDRIVAVNGARISGLMKVIETVGTLRGDSATLTVRRGADTLMIRTFVDPTQGVGLYFQSPTEILGVERVSYDLIEAVPAGLQRAFSRLSSYTSSLKYVATKEGASKLGGLGTIGSLFPATFSWYDFWSMTAFLSIILAVMNLLPIPGLDGGHVLFLLIEWITRRKLSIKTQERIQIVGMIFLLLLMVYANLNDVRRFLL